MYEEKDVYEILGIEQPAEESAAADDMSAEAASGAGDQTEESQETGEGTAQVEEESGRDEEQTPDQSDDHEVEKAGEAMSKAERAKFAAQRRKAETDAAIQAALQQQKAEFDGQIRQLIAGMNLKDPTTGQPVTNLEEYNAMQKNQQQRQIQKNLREGKLLPEDLQAMIQTELAQQGKADQPRAQQQPDKAAKEDFQRRVEAEFAAISQMDPNVKNLEDALKLETGKEFAAAVKRGATFLEAFKIANFDRLQKAGREESAKRAQQAALNSQRSKEHLTASAAKGSGQVAVPADTMAMYRMLMPNASDDEIAAHYNKTYKSIK